MKKIILLIVFVLLLSGCTINGVHSYNEKYFTEVKECVRANINKGKNIRFYEEYVMLLIPITKDNGCSLDFDDDSYDYAFLGITYENAQGAYNYFLYSRDKNGNGYDQSEFTMHGLTESKDVEVNGILKDLYANKDSYKSSADFEYSIDEFKPFNYDIYENYRTLLVGEISFNKFEKNPE